LTFALALNQFTIPAILQVKVLPVEVWIRFSTNLEPAQALAASWPLVLFPLIALLCLRRVDIRWNAESGPTTVQAFRRQIGNAWFTSALATTICLVAISVGLPILQLLTTSATWTQFRAAADATWPLTLNSFSFAAGAASIIVAINAIVRHWIFGLTLWLLFLIPGMLLSIGVIWLLNRPGLDIIYRSAAVIFVVLGMRYAGPAWALLRHAFTTSDPSLIESARLDGLRGWRFFRHIHWPRLAPAGGAAWYVSYLLCLWDVETLTLLYPPGTETLALRIFNLLHYGHNAQVNALCLLLLAVAALPAVAYGLWTGVRSFSRSV
jgi:iron(III) transport system permease protein